MLFNPAAVNSLLVTSAARPLPGEFAVNSQTPKLCNSQPADICFLLTPSLTITTQPTSLLLVCQQYLLGSAEGVSCTHTAHSNKPAQRSLHCPADDSTAPVADRQLACSVSLQDDSPVLHVVESCALPHHNGITLRKYALHSVDDDHASHTPSQPATSGGSSRWSMVA